MLDREGGGGLFEYMYIMFVLRKSICNYLSNILNIRPNEFVKEIIYYYYNLNKLSSRFGEDGPET